jgi:hypothetical protein
VISRPTESNEMRSGYGPSSEGAEAYRGHQLGGSAPMDGILGQQTVASAIVQTRNGRAIARRPPECTSSVIMVGPFRCNKRRRVHGGFCTLRNHGNVPGFLEGRVRGLAAETPTPRCEWHEGTYSGPLKGNIRSQT